MVRDALPATGIPGPARLRSAPPRGVAGAGLGVAQADVGQGGGRYRAADRGVAVTGGDHPGGALDQPGGGAGGHTGVVAPPRRWRSDAGAADAQRVAADQRIGAAEVEGERPRRVTGSVDHLDSACDVENLAGLEDTVG